MSVSDKSNRCPNCGHTRGSRTHYLRCKGGTRAAWASAHHGRGGASYIPRRANASAVLSHSHAGIAPITPISAPVAPVTRQEDAQ